MKTRFKSKAQTASHPIGVGPQASRWRLLVVDDDPEVRESLAAVLREEGYQVLTAAGGHQALSLAAGASPDLVLLDLNMPDQSGWDTFEQLTRDNPLLPVLVVTARANQLFTALSAGVGALLEKPLDIPALLETVSALLAEPAEVRLARMAGREAPFHYLPQGGPRHTSNG